MNKVMNSLLITCLVFLCLLTGSATAQIVYGEPPAVEASFVYQSWKITGDPAGTEFKLHQWYMPIYGFIPVREDWELHISSATASSGSDSAGNTVSITGLNDTQISLVKSFMEDKFLVGVGLNIPTGKTKLDQDQSGLGQLLTSEFLNIPSKTYGEGFGLYFETAYARELGRLNVGVGAGYLLSTSYSPIEGVDKYDPGDRLTIGANASLRHQFGVGYLYAKHMLYGTSAQDGVDIYKNGPIAEIGLGSSFGYERFQSDAGVRFVLRQTDSRYVDGGLVKLEHNNYGSDIRIYASLGYLHPSVGRGSVLLDFKRVGANDFAETDAEYHGKSNIAGIGIGYDRQATQAVSVSASFKSFGGSADDGNLDLSGIELSLGIRVTL
jgi:hypothetical protein